MNAQSRIICFVGPSGVGKTSYAKRLEKKYGFTQPSVVTTRQRRSDDGDNYTYVTEAVFIEMVESGSFIEWDQYSNYWYGTLLQSVREAVSSNRYCGVVLDLTPSGCRKLKEVMPPAIIIALLPDDPAWLFERLKSRNSQPVEEIEARTALLKDYLDEMALLTCNKVYVSFSPESWETTFEAIEKIVFEPEIYAAKSF